MNVLLQKWPIFRLLRTKNLKIFSARAFGARGSVSGSLLMASAAKNDTFELMRLRHLVVLHVFGAIHAAIAVEELQESRIETFANNTYMYERCNYHCNRDSKTSTFSLRG